MIHPIYYGIIFLYIIVIITLIVAPGYSNQSYYTIKKGRNNTIAAFILCFLLSLWIGLRPSIYNYIFFADSYLYAHIFSLMQGVGEGAYEESSEWIWYGIMKLFAATSTIEMFFTLVAFGYFFCTFFSCRILTPNNVLVSVLFMMGSFSFYSYGVNGIRNGLACSVVLLAIAMLARSRKSLAIVLGLSFVAVNIHKSALLPLVALFAAVYFVKSFKWAYTFWLLSIIISLVAGGAVTAMFAGLGFDDRLSYLTAEHAEGMFSKTSFRWDFLVYSMMPIVLGYYVVIKRGIQDRTYSILLNTYTLANAFWVMVIRANYSNRFAYLSWFMYPIVLAYPLLCLDIWGEKQGARLKQIMLAHIGFTWFMQTIYW